jgi:hypothetical protein
MQIEVQELIDRAKTYVDDEHRAEDAWISPERWLSFFNTERRKLYKQWIRAGLVIPSPTESYLQGESTSFTGVLAVVGVGKDMQGPVQTIPNASMNEGRQPFWRSATQISTPGSKWAAFGVGTTVTIELDGTSDLTYTAPEAAVQATLDFSSFGYALLDTLTDGVLRAKTAGVAGNDYGVRFVGDATGDSYWTNAGDTYLYHFDATVADTLAFEASVAADTTLPFEVLTASTINAAWSDWGSIENLTLTALPFAGGEAAIVEEGNYLIRYIPTLAAVTDATTVVDLPDGGDERLVLGMARRSLIKESGASRRLDQEILDSDAELNLAAHAAMGGIKMRRNGKNSLVPVYPNRWIYFG